jgi:pimeloyl-ACP methyl ester carboxylesterase
LASFVLIHGAYQGGWIWRFVAARLRAAGQDAFAPTLDGCAERRHQLRPGITTETHAAEIAELLFYEDLREAVLVGTSAGGMVLCRAAELARDRIGRVVFVDALALLDGERLPDIVQRPASTSTELATGPTREDVEGRMFAALDPAIRGWAADRITPHPIAVMREPVRLERFWSERWDATVIRCLRAVNPPEAHQRRTAERLGARYLELDTGHYPMLSMPEELAGLITRDE